jgi:hypothetical protein
MSIKYYLADTRPAVESQFGVLAAYSSMTKPPSLEKFSDKKGVVKLSLDDAKEYINAKMNSLALEFAKSVIAGSILQVAYLAIKLYSNNNVIPNSASQLGVKKKSAALPFAIGREEKSIPLGLLIYAGRIQYNHWEEGTPRNNVAKKVFYKLQSEYYDDPNFDIGYVLDIRDPRPVSHYLLQKELQWFRYQDFEQDILQMLGD